MWERGALSGFKRGTGCSLRPRLSLSLASIIDVLQHLAESRHVAVYHKGRFFKVWLYEGSRLLKPRDIEMQFQRILDDPSLPQPGEEKLAALTAGGRVEWAEARQTFFSSGKNKIALDTIERAAFFVALDEESHCCNPDDVTNLSLYGKALLHGNCYNRYVAQTHGSEVRVKI